MFDCFAQYCCYKTVEPINVSYDINLGPFLLVTFLLLGDTVLLSFVVTKLFNPFGRDVIYGRPLVTYRPQVRTHRRRSSSALKRNFLKHYFFWNKTISKGSTFETRTTTNCRVFNQEWHIKITIFDFSKLFLFLSFSCFEKCSPRIFMRLSSTVVLK